jgi:hypothetical protein
MKKKRVIELILRMFAPPHSIYKTTTVQALSNRTHYEYSPLLNEMSKQDYMAIQSGDDNHSLTSPTLPTSESTVSGIIIDNDNRLYEYGKIHTGERQLIQTSALTIHYTHTGESLNTCKYPNCSKNIIDVSKK